MESLKYEFEGRGFLFSDSGLELPVDSFSRSRNLLKEWNLEPFPDVDRSMISPNDEVNERSEFMESGLAEMLQKSSVGNLGLRLSSGQTETDNDFRKYDYEKSAQVDSKSKELSSKSGSVLTPRRVQEPSMQPDVHVYQVHDTNKAVSNDSKEAKSSQSSKKNSDFSSAEPSSTAKRARIANFSSQVLICQVHGCNQDLSSSKDYHKRHKVCDEHSKTAKVIVNGIEQRFCQQCSRFHLLSEFDDDKRSCRKRLAGHNERRRKPQRDTHWDIAASRFLDLSSERTISFLFPEILNGSYFFQETYEQEAKPSCSSQLSALQQSEPPKNHHLVQELSGGENSLCPHSLLSAHNEKVLTDSPGFSTIHPTMIAANHHPSYLKMDQNLGMPNLGVTASTSFGLSELDAAYGVVDREGVLEARDGNVGVHYEAEMDGDLQSSDSMNISYYISPASGPTINLQQLSTHLLRVEQQRSYAQVNHMFVNENASLL